MLTSDAINSALPLTEVLDTNNLSLSPIPGTPLEALVNATRSDQNFAKKLDNNYELDLSNIEYIANIKDPVLGVSPHDSAMDNLVEVAGRAVRNHMVFAKNVVAPVVEELADKTLATLNEITGESLLGMDVVVANPPKPLLSSAFETSVRRFEEVPFEDFSLNMHLPSLPASEITELMKIGTSGLDADIAEWAAGKGDSFFLNIWENVFQTAQASLTETKTVTFTTFTEDRQNGYDNSVAIYLLSRRLADETIPGIEMSANAFQKAIIDFRNQSGARLCRAIDDLNNINKTGQLVSTISGMTTVVNGSVYAKWIEEGGDNDVLFGNTLNLPGFYTVDSINNNASKLKAAWNKHSLLTKTVFSNRRYAKTKEILFRHFQEQMRHVTETEDNTPANAELVSKLFQEQLDSVTDQEMTNMYSLCLKLVCRSRFYRTEAERILSGIERVKKENPSVDIREAAAISVIEYIAFWLSTQLKVNAK